MTELTIEDYVNQQIELMQQQGLVLAAVPVVISLL